MLSLLMARLQILYSKGELETVLHCSDYSTTNFSTGNSGILCSGNAVVCLAYLSVSSSAITVSSWICFGCSCRHIDRSFHGLPISLL